MPANGRRVMTTMLPRQPGQKDGRKASSATWHIAVDDYIRERFQDTRGTDTPWIRFAAGPEDLRDDLVGSERAAAFLGCGRHSLHQLRAYAGLPHYVIAEGKRRSFVYFLSELASWRERRASGRLYR